MALGTLGQYNIASPEKDQVGACREKAETIINNERDRHLREYSTWSWLQEAIKKNPPSSMEEAGLWDLLNRSRRY